MPLPVLKDCFKALFMNFFAPRAESSTLYPFASIAVKAAEKTHPVP